MDKKVIYILLAIAGIVAVYFLFIRKTTDNKNISSAEGNEASGLIYPTISTNGWEGDVLRHEGNRFTPEAGKWVYIGKA